MASVLEDCLDLARRLSPAQVVSNLEDLVSLQPDLSEDLLSCIDQPLRIDRCKASNKEYILCDYNRDGDSFRLSPFHDLLSFEVSLVK